MRIPKILTVLSLLTAALAANATIIDFTGGSGTGYLTSYQENGFQVDIIGGGGAFFQDYYGVGNNVIHAHWSPIDAVTEIKITKIGGGTFDLNYFILTSNTELGGGPASGNEKTYITHDGSVDPILLPPENWGFPATQIFLPSTYDNISSFSFHVENFVFCFGMDEFYIDEPAPPAVPDTGSALSLFGLSLAALASLRARVRP